MLRGVRRCGSLERTCGPKAKSRPKTQNRAADVDSTETAVGLGRDELRERNIDTAREHRDATP